MSKRFTMLIEDDVHEELESLSRLLSVAKSEFGRRGLDMLLGRNGFPPPPPWPHPGDDFVPRRPGIRFEDDRRRFGQARRHDA